MVDSRTCHLHRLESVQVQVQVPGLQTRQQSSLYTRQSSKLFVTQFTLEEFLTWR
jgi:hypothetical protein